MHSGAGPQPSRGCVDGPTRRLARDVRRLVVPDGNQRRSIEIRGQYFKQNVHHRRVGLIINGVINVAGFKKEIARTINDRLFRQHVRHIPRRQLPDAGTNSYFTKAFGRPAREQTCECERTAAPSMSQALHIANGDTLNQKLKAKKNRIEQLLEAKTADEKLVEEVYLAALSRFPGEAEKAKLLTLLAESKDATKREIVEDLYWGILSSKEFLFNH